MRFVKLYLKKSIFSTGIPKAAKNQQHSIFRNLATNAGALAGLLRRIFVLLKRSVLHSKSFQTIHTVIVSCTCMYFWFLSCNDDAITDAAITNTACHSGRRYLFAKQRAAMGHAIFSINRISIVATSAWVAVSRRTNEPLPTPLRIVVASGFAAAISVSAAGAFAFSAPSCWLTSAAISCICSTWDLAAPYIDYAPSKRPPNTSIE